MDILILDPQTGRSADRCTGPAPNGACPRAQIGDVVACAGEAVIPAKSAGTTYGVPACMTLCPVTVALSLAVASDTSLLAD
jgi:hypothetical protein